MNIGLVSPYQKFSKNFMQKPCRSLSRARPTTTLAIHLFCQSHDCTHCACVALHHGPICNRPAGEGSREDAILPVPEQGSFHPGTAAERRRPWRHPASPAQLPGDDDWLLQRHRNGPLHRNRSCVCQSRPGRATPRLCHRGLGPVVRDAEYRRVGHASTSHTLGFNAGKMLGVESLN